MQLFRLPLIDCLSLHSIPRSAIYASAMLRGRSGTDHRAPLIYADNYRQILLLSRSRTN